MDTEVLIVGAGPSGLVLANVLAEAGVAVRVVDRKTRPVVQSRAAIIHVRTLELLDRLGLADRAIRLGVRTTTVSLCERGRPMGEFSLAGKGMEGLTPFPYALSLEQHRTEQLLIDGLAERGGRVEWNTELVSVTNGADSHDGATALLRGPGGPESVSARWVVGADGAASRVRHALGIGFAGKTYEQTGFLADVEMDLADSARLGAGILRLNLTRGGFVGVFGLRPDLYRLFGAVPPHLAERDRSDEVSHDAYASVDLADIQRWFDDYFFVDARLTRAEWTSLFRIHSRIAERFRVGRVFLVGDAAHIHSPAGGQGMNLGIGDAVNLGWKLAAVTKGDADERLLDSYEAERRPVAATVLRFSDRGFALEANNNPIVEWLRANVATRLIGPLTRLSAVRNAIFRLFSQTWISYRDSPVVARGAAEGTGPAPGDRAPFDPRLFDRACGLRHHLVLFEGARADPALGAYRRAVAEILGGYRFACDITVVPSAERRPHELYGATGARFVLIRPDGHIGYTGGLADLGGLAGYLDSMFTRTTSARCPAST